MSIEPTPPFVWPESRVLSGSIGYADAPVFRRLLSEAESIIGVVSDFAPDGIEKLEFLLSRDEQSPKIRILLSLYAACSTQQNDLEALVQLQESTRPRAEFRILISRRWPPSPTNILLLRSGNPPKTYICIGSTGNFGLAPADPAQINLVFAPDDRTIDEWRKWFDFTWAKQAAPLTHATVKIPPLVPATGTPEAEAMWRAYLDECKQAGDLEKMAAGSKVQVDPKTGEVTELDGKGRIIPSPTSEIGLAKADPIVLEMQSLYGRGLQVTINKSTRSRPLDVPLKPEYFGLKSFSQIGAISRRITMKISALDPDTLKETERIRSATREVLTKFSFGLADSVRWMPLKARSLFEEELANREKQGSELLMNSIGPDVDLFLDMKEQDVRNDADRLYHELKPGKQTPDWVIQVILRDLRERLTEAVSGKLMPDVTYQDTSFSTEHSSAHSDPWEQALFFLVEILKYPRESKTDTYFFRGITTKPEDLLEAINVLDDDEYRDVTQSTNRPDPARQLEMIKAITNLKGDAREKCRVLLSMARSDWETVNKMLES